MTLIVTDKAGPLSVAIGHRLDEQAIAYEVAPPDDEDLFEKALEHTALVYLPSPRMLDATLHPRPSTGRAQAVLAAANAPGVEVVVFVLPDGDGYDEEKQLLQRKGVPYVIVVAPPLLEEIAKDLSTDRARTLWVPRGGGLEVSTVEQTARAVVEAIDCEDQGGAFPAPRETLDAETLFRRATELQGEVRVRGVRPGVFRLARPIARWVKRGEPAALRLCDQLYADLTRPVHVDTAAVSPEQSLRQAA